MRPRWPKLCALVLALAMVPGAFELVENVLHVVSEGHLAHAVSHDDEHEPSGPEHGCSLVFHFCGCHASLALWNAPPPPAIALHAAGDPSPRISERLLTGVWKSIDRPPQA